MARGFAGQSVRCHLALSTGRAGDVEKAQSLSSRELSSVEGPESPTKVPRGCSPSVRDRDCSRANGLAGR